MKGERVMTLSSNKVSSNNRLVKVYRWFKRRQHAIDFKAQMALKEHDETLQHGTPFKWCPTARMAIIWGPFLIFPFWVGRFILFPIGIGTIAFGLFGGVGMSALAGLNFMEYPTTLIGTVVGMFAGLLFILFSSLVLLLAIGAIFRISESAGDRLRAMQREKTEKKAEAEVRAAPIISAWLKGLHDKFCPTATIVVEAEA